MKTVTTTAATVLKVGKSVPSKFEGKPNRKALTVAAAGNEIEIWIDDVGPAAAVQPGASVTLVDDGKGYAIADVSPQPFQAAQALPPQAQRPAALRRGNFFDVPDRETRENMLKYIEWESKLYRTCYEQACEAMKEFGLDKYNTKDIATTLFLSVQRRYNLQ